MPRLAIEPSELPPSGRDARQTIDNARMTRLGDLETKLHQTQAALATERQEKAKLEAAVFRLRGTAARPLTRDIAEYVAAKHDVRVDEVLGRCRVRHVVMARHEFFYECLRLRPDLAMVRIAGLLGFDHTTVMHGAAAHVGRGAPLIERNGMDLDRRLSRAREWHRNKRLNP